MLRCPLFDPSLLPDLWAWLCLLGQAACCRCHPGALPPAVPIGACASDPSPNTQHNTGLSARGPVSLGIYAKPQGAVDHRCRGRHRQLKSFCDLLCVRKTARGKQQALICVASATPGLDAAGHPARCDALDAALTRGSNMGCRSVAELLRALDPNPAAHVIGIGDSFFGVDLLSEEQARRRLDAFIGAPCYPPFPTLFRLDASALLPGRSCSTDSCVGVNLLSKQQARRRLAAFIGALCACSDGSVFPGRARRSCQHLWRGATEATADTAVEHCQSAVEHLQQTRRLQQCVSVLSDSFA